MVSDAVAATMRRAETPTSKEQDLVGVVQSRGERDPCDSDLHLVCTVIAWG